MLRESETGVIPACPSRAEQLGLGTGHRLGSAALLLLVGGAAALLAHKPHALLLRIAFGCGDVALLGSFVSLVLGRRAGRRSGEAFRTVLFCAGMLLVAALLLVVSRLREEN